MTILIKGRDISFEVLHGKTLTLPKSHGMIHNPDVGGDGERCRVYFGPYEKTDGAVTKLTTRARNYFGGDYQGRHAYVNFPSGKWKLSCTIMAIFYQRDGEHADYYRHEFERPLPLYELGKFYRLNLGKGCVLNDRGYVFP